LSGINDDDNIQHKKGGLLHAAALFIFLLEFLDEITSASRLADNAKWSFAAVLLPTLYHKSEM
jgi:hypothetical protein